MGRYDSTPFKHPLNELLTAYSPLPSPTPPSGPGPSLDRLGTFVAHAAHLLESGLPFPDLCSLHRGPSCLSNPAGLPHPAVPLLQHLRLSGASAPQSTPSWSPSRLASALSRGPHPSAKLNATFLRSEFADMVAAGHWLVVPYHLVCHLPGLRLSPTGVVPQRNRRDRTIVDYTFSGVNDHTVSVAPDSLQFGHAFPRLLTHLHRADTRHGPVYLSKTDIADAFMRVWLHLDAILTLGALLPPHPNEPPLVAFPLVLPMGWVDSPRYLCAVTETVADLTNARFRHLDLAATPHRLDSSANTAPDPIPHPPDSTSGSLPHPTVRSSGPLCPPLTTADVFMDDFLLATQQPRALRPSVRRTLFECIDAVLRPLSPTDNPARKEPNSVKKLLQGDAAWSTRKVILGWLVDTIQRTIALPPHRVLRLHTLLASFPSHQRRTSRRKWQCLLGELRSMALALPGGRGLFSQLQSVLTYSASASPSDRLCLSPAVHHQLNDIRHLASSLSARPTRWGELVDSDPSFLGAVDACVTGMGGVWLDTRSHHPPLLWRQSFPLATQSALVSFANPRGSITNSDLEQVGVVCHSDILAQHHDLRERTICTLSDNTAAVSRELRGSTSADAPSAYLCRLASLHQRHFRYRLQAAYIPGPINVMADTLSRRWDLSDDLLLSHFNSLFPQVRPWQLCHLRSNMNSGAISALSKLPCSLAFLADESQMPPPTLRSGSRSVSNTVWTPTSPLLPIQSRGFKSSLPKFAAAGFLPAATLSDLAQWRTRSTSLRRRSPSWVRPIPASPPAPPILISA